MQNDKPNTGGNLMSPHKKNNLITSSPQQKKRPVEQPNEVKSKATRLFADQSQEEQEEFREKVQEKLAELSESHEGKTLSRQPSQTIFSPPICLFGKRSSTLDGSQDESPSNVSSARRTPEKTEESQKAAADREHETLSPPKKTHSKRIFGSDDSPTKSFLLPHSDPGFSLVDVTNVVQTEKVLGLKAISYEEEEEEEEESYVDQIEFLNSLPPLETLGNRPIILPPKQTSFQKTLVLDLDETLVHCSTDGLSNPDLSFGIEFNDEKFTVYARKRPHLEKFLELVSSMFEVIIFTASQKVYADTLLNIIDKENKWIHHRLFRESCLYIGGNYLKELSVLGRDLSQTIIIDNSPHAFTYQVSNGIPIESWYEDQSDKELLRMAEFLKSIIDVEDVRIPIGSGLYNNVFIDELQDPEEQEEESIQNTEKTNEEEEKEEKEEKETDGSDEQKKQEQEQEKKDDENKQQKQTEKEQNENQEISSEKQKLNP